MGTTMGALSLVTVLAGAVLASACGHLTKYKVEEVPIDTVQAPAPIAIAGEDAGATVPPVIDMGPGPGAPTTTAAVATGATAGPAPTPIGGGEETPTGDPNDPKVQAAIKLMKSGKKTDLVTAKKILSASVFAGTGTADQARFLRLVCSKLGDKPCVAKCASYIK